MLRCTITSRTTSISSSFQTAPRSRLFLFLYGKSTLISANYCLLIWTFPSPKSSAHSQQLCLQVCNAVYLRLNFSVPLCACPEPGDPCSASTLASDGHSLGLTADQASGKVLTLAKTCEEVESIRTCDQNRDWSILALQNIRTGKAHYLVICTCPDSGFLGKTSQNTIFDFNYSCLQRVPWHRRGLLTPRCQAFGSLACSVSRVEEVDPSEGRPRCCGVRRCPSRTSPLSPMCRSTSGTQLATCELQYTCQQYAVTKRKIHIQEQSTKSYLNQGSSHIYMFNDDRHPCLEQSLET